MPADALHASMPTDVQEPMAARGPSDPLGKLDDRIEEFRIDSETRALLSLQAARAGKNLTEFIRFVLQVQAHGPERIRSLHLRKFDLVGNLSALDLLREES